MADEKEKQGWKFTIKLYDSSPMATEDVLNGRIAAAGMNYPPARDAEKKKPVKIIGSFGEIEEFGAAVRKEDTELLETLNKGFELLMADPYWDELIDKYLN
jgi:polar amino acid transport system substrate-binding protein